MERKKPADLQQVEDDATRITQKRFRDQEEERQYKISQLEPEPTNSPVPEETASTGPSEEETKRGPGRPKKEEE